MVRTGKRLRSTVVTSTACLTAVGLVLAMAATAQARVTRIAIEKKVSPAFDGASFGSAGPYETLAGKAFGELDPNDPTTPSSRTSGSRPATPAAWWNTPRPSRS